MKITRLAASAALALAAGVLANAAAPLAQDSGAAPPVPPPPPATPVPVNPPRAGSGQPAPPSPAAVARGRKAFDRYCISCHGLEGDGRGPTADWIDPRPRVLTSGTFKFRSTPSGELPTDADILRTITNGLHGAYMPRWAPITARERADLVQLVKSLSPRFATEAQSAPIAIPPRPPFGPQLVQQGREVWRKMQCAACHGDTGKGDGSSAQTLRDDWGYPIPPHDFTRGPLKVGDAPEDLYRTFMTGLNGSPMPSYADTLSPDDAWALVAYVRTLRKE